MWVYSPPGPCILTSEGLRHNTVMLVIDVSVIFTSIHFHLQKCLNTIQNTGEQVLNYTLKDVFIFYYFNKSQFQDVQYILVFLMLTVHV